MNKKQQKIIKESFLKALRKSGGIITPACEAVGISRMTVWNWRKADHEFNAAIEEMNEMTLDIAESALLKNVQAGDTNAIKFFLSTKGRSRGYGERVDVQADGVTIVVKSEDERSKLERIENVGI